MGSQATPQSEFEAMVAASYEVDVTLIQECLQKSLTQRLKDATNAQRAIEQLKLSQSDASEIR